jgi:hypothetical protein
MEAKGQSILLSRRGDLWTYSSFAAADWRNSSNVVIGLACDLVQSTPVQN